MAVPATELKQTFINQINTMPERKLLILMGYSQMLDEEEGEEYLTDEEILAVEKGKAEILAGETVPYEVIKKRENL